MLRAKYRTLPPKQNRLGWGSRIVLVLAFCLTLAAPAFAREWRITHFDDELSVAQDGTMTVREHLVVYFDGQYHGIYRDIPIQYPGPHGSNYTLFLSVTSVTDGWNHKL